MYIESFILFFNTFPLDDNLIHEALIPLMLIEEKTVLIGYEHKTCCHMIKIRIMLTETEKEILVSFN